MNDPCEYVSLIVIVSVTFLIYDAILFYTYPEPKKLKMIDDKAQRKKLYYAHVASRSSIIHAVALIVGSIIILTELGIDYERYNKNEENLLMCFSIGYFISDTIIGFIARYNDYLMVFHHLLGIAGLSYSIITQKYGSGVMCLFGIAEISNPFMLIRKDLELYENTEFLSIVFGLSFAITFLICRTVVFGLCIIPLQTSNASLVSKLICGLIWYISLYWCYMIINLLTKFLIETFHLKFLEGFYALLIKSRKSSAFILFLHINLVMICFMIPIYFWNHDHIT